jgi:hypothetical protein
LFPLIVNVNAAPPAFAEFGLRETIEGTGFSVGGGGPSPELPDPPQPINETATRQAKVAREQKVRDGTVLRIDFTQSRKNNDEFYSINSVFVTLESSVS